MSGYDFAIVGAGIAGASLAAELAPHGRVLILEGEEQPGYHSTGRSAAFWSETYGGPFIQPLTTASAAGLAPFLEPLGSLHIARGDEQAAVDAYLAEFAGSGVILEPVDPREHIPGLRPEWSLAVYEPSCAYIDVGGLLAACLKAARQAGAELRTSARLQAARREGGGWKLETSAGAFEADVLVNAAGAWADPVAAMAGARPLGIQPYRRTLLQIHTDPEPPVGLPHVGHLTGSFYFKPEAGGRLWLSPHDEIASDPCDAQPEDIDVAIAIDRFEHCVDWRVAKLEHKWAGAAQLRARPAAGLRLRSRGRGPVLVRGAGRLRHPDRPGRSQDRGGANHRSGARRLGGGNRSPTLFAGALLGALTVSASPRPHRRRSPSPAPAGRRRRAP